MLMQVTKEWRKFAGTVWQRDIDVRDFIFSNVTPYTGDEASSSGRPRGPAPCGKSSSLTSARS